MLLLPNQKRFNGDYCGIYDPVLLMRKIETSLLLGPSAHVGKWKAYGIRRVWLNIYVARRSEHHCAASDGADKVSLLLLPMVFCSPVLLSLFALKILQSLTVMLYAAEGAVGVLGVSRTAEGDAEQQRGLRAHGLHKELGRRCRSRSLLEVEPRFPRR